LTRTENKEYRTRSEEKQNKGVVYKDNETRNIIRDGHVTEVTNAAAHALKANKNLAVKNYGDIEVLTKERIKKTLIGSSSYQNLTNEDILIGNTEVNWKKELKEGVAIDKIVVDQMGLGRDILTLADVNGDGTVDETDSDPKLLERKRYWVKKAFTG